MRQGRKSVPLTFSIPFSIVERSVEPPNHSGPLIHRGQFQKRVWYDIHAYPNKYFGSVPLVDINNHFVAYIWVGKKQAHANIYIEDHNYDWVLWEHMYCSSIINLTKKLRRQYREQL